MACRLTTGEQAAARIIVDEIVSQGGICSAYLDRIAARAGICVKTAQRALRRLSSGKRGYEDIEGLHWCTVTERPVKGTSIFPTSSALYRKNGSRGSSGAMVQ